MRRRPLGRQRREKTATVVAVFLSLVIRHSLSGTQDSAVNFSVIANEVKQSRKEAANSLLAGLPRHL